MGSVKNTFQCLWIHHFFTFALPSLLSFYLVSTCLSLALNNSCLILCLISYPANYFQSIDFPHGDKWVIQLTKPVPTQLRANPQVWEGEGVYVLLWLSTFLVILCNTTKETFFLLTYCRNPSSFRLMPVSNCISQGERSNK